MISVISQFAALMVDPPLESHGRHIDAGRANAVKHRTAVWSWKPTDSSCRGVPEPPLSPPGPGARIW